MATKSGDASRLYLDFFSALKAPRSQSDSQPELRKVQMPARNSSVKLSSPSNPDDTPLKKCRRNADEGRVKVVAQKRKPDGVGTVTLARSFWPLGPQHIPRIALA